MKRKISLQSRYKIQGILFALPFIIGFLAFFIYPISKSLQLAFGNLDSILGFKISGFTLEHFERAFREDVNFIPRFIDSVEYTLLFVPLILIFSMMIAMLINRPMKFRVFFRTVFFLPFLLGTGTVMRQILSLDVEQTSIEVARGIIFTDEILNYLGPKVTDYVFTFLYAITLILWKSSVQILLFLSGLQNIPAAMYEAAKVDSANAWDMFWKITLPIMTPVILLCGVYSVVDTFYDTNNRIVDYINDFAFGQTQFEYSSAMSWIYAAFALLFIGLIFLSMRKSIYREKENVK